MTFYLSIKRKIFLYFKLLLCILFQETLTNNLVYFLLLDIHEKVLITEFLTTLPSQDFTEFNPLKEKVADTLFDSSYLLRTTLCSGMVN